MKQPTILENLPWRIAGLVLLGVLVVAYQPDLHHPIHRLLIPIAMAVATWMLVQNAAAVALGAGLLAGIHGNPGSADWIVGVAYPALAALCAAIVAVVFWRRFRRRIVATHQARWHNRRHDQQRDDER